MFFEKWFPVDLLKLPSHVQDVGMPLFVGDNDAIRIGATVQRGGVDEDVTGTVKGYVILPSGADIAPFDGYKEGNKAWIDLPGDALCLSGRIQIALRVFDGEAVTTLAATTATVRRADGDTHFDPEDVVGDLTTLISRAEQATTAAEQATEAAQQAVEQTSNILRYDAQTLDAAEQAQARENIGAADEEDFDAVAYPLDVEMLTSAGEAVRVLSGGLGTSGGDTNNTARARTQYFRVQPGQRYVFSLGNAEFGINSVFEYSGTTQGTVIGRLDPAYYPKSRVAFTASGKYVRIAFAHIDNTVTMTDDDRDAILAAISLRSVDGGQIPINSDTPVIVAQQGAAYICGTVTELTFTPSSSGLCEVVFTTGSTPTVLTLPSTVRMPDWWTGVEAGRTYDLMILNGTLAGVMSWAT